MKTITVSSFKGGTGKSSLVLLLANVYAAAGKRVLVIDTDHQQNATRYHATSWDDVHKKNIAEAIHRDDLTANILPSHIENTDFVAGSMRTLRQRIAPPVIKNLLAPVTGYDICLIDTHPSAETVVVSAWNAADTILTPARLDTFDYDGVFDLAQMLELEAPGIDWKIVLNFYNQPRVESSTNLTFNFEQEFTARYPNIISPRIPESKIIERAIHNGEVISTAKTKRKVYSALKELAEIIGGETLTIPGEAI